jgi:transposase
VNGLCISVNGSDVNSYRFKARLTEMVEQLFSQSKLTEAINYALNHWDGLTLFLSDGRIEVDSNTVERSMRPIAMGRRNSLFSGSEGGAESWATCPRS